MQLHHLTLSGIGPFASTFHINFHNLAASGLFLLEGPTGSGKSTIIDAIVFALYGKVASAETSDDRMRSDHAADSTESYVDLVFETGSGIYRVIRKPERLRPKKRGTGMIKEQASIRLFRLSVADFDILDAAHNAGDDPSAIAQREYGQPRSSRLDEAGIELTNIIGLSREQFVQTIVLPQGEFAQFLKANPEDRRQLLQRVFGTEIYERAQAELAAMKRDATQSIEKAQARRSEAIRAFVQETGATELGVEALNESSDEEVRSALTQVLEHLESRKQDTAQAEIDASNAELHARDALDRARLLAARHAQRATAREELAQLKGSAQRIAEQEQILDAALRASYVTTAAQHSTTAQSVRNQALDTLVADIERAQDFAELGPVQGDVRKESQSSVAVFARSFQENRTELEEQRSHAQITMGSLRELEALEKGLIQREKDVQALSVRLQRHAQNIADLDQKIAARPQEHALLIEQRDQHSAQGAQVAVLTEKIAAAQSLVELHTQVAKSKAQLDHAAVTAATALEAATQATRMEATLRERWLKGLAGELAGELEDGKPCAVCGSPDHPHPAQSSPDATTKADVTAAENTRIVREQESQKASAALAAAQENYSGLTLQLKDSTAQDAAEQLERARTELSQAQTAVELAKKLTTTILAHETDTKKLESQRTSAIAENAELTAKISLLRANIQEDTNSIGNELERLSTILDQPFESLGQAAKFLQSRATSITALLSSLDGFTAAQRTHEERAAELTKALKEHDFTQVEDALAAALEPAERTRLASEITAHKQRLAAVTSRLESEEFAQVPEELDQDPAALKLAHDQALSALKLASVAAERAKAQRIGGLARSQNVEQVMAELGNHRDAVLPIIRMADIANANSSDNTARVTLATFVLLRRFEDVLSAANTRLLALSDGRYELERSEHKEDVKSRKRGLALQVTDHNTDKPRDPRTLSGGETFIASLSLALGLADVVTAEAGGVELGTLFIDEGFGTLDSEALEKVLSVLSALREGGRTVGVVSHVETLKQSISDGISVRRTEHGTSTLTVRA